MNEALAEYLAPTSILDADHHAVAAYAARHVDPGADPTATAVNLVYAVRDDLRYDPYGVITTVEAVRASSALEARRGWCVSKAALLTACCRARGIPARVGFADVRNHLSTARMREMMKTEVFYWHGYSSIWLEGAGSRRRRPSTASSARNSACCRSTGMERATRSITPTTARGEGTWNTSASGASSRTCRSSACARPGAANTPTSRSGRAGSRATSTRRSSRRTRLGRSPRRARSPESNPACPSGP
ncbi:MAG: transglutaminase family protein [Myxococcales bacterium]|nr:MAG: transglutaminase family protein [Myxococcales bacterium]